MYKKYQNGEISRKLSILGKSVSDKKCRFKQIYLLALLVWFWMVLPRSHQSDINLFKWNTLFLISGIKS